MAWLVVCVSTRRGTGKNWGGELPESIDWPKLVQPSRRRNRKFFILLALIALILFGSRTVLSYWVDLLWFRSLGYGNVFMRTLTLQWGIFAIFAPATFLTLYGAFLLLKRAHIDDMRPFEQQKCAVESEECSRRKDRKNPPLQGQRPHEHIPIAQRPEPQQVNPIGQYSAAAEQDQGDQSKKNKELAVATPRRLHELGPIYRFRQLSTPILAGSSSGGYANNQPRHEEVTTYTLVLLGPLCIAQVAVGVDRALARHISWVPILAARQEWETSNLKRPRS